MEIVNPTADEQLVIVFMVYDKSKSPIDFSRDIITVFKTSLPDLKASDWHSDPGSSDTTVSFKISYSDKARMYAGNGLVIKSESQLYWFSFSSPITAYSKVRALKILEGTIGSMASDTNSKPPAFDVPELGALVRPTPKQIQNNADAFLFVLEFSLGAPLSSADEKTIQAELKKAWTISSAEELKPFNEYPKLVKTILSADENQITQLHNTLHASTKEWLDSTDSSDLTVRIIRSQLERNSYILTGDSPGLSELAAESYSEMIAFAELLYNNPKSTLNQIPQSKLMTIKKKLITSWAGFSERERNSIIITPAIWITIRQILKFGTVEEQMKMRSTVRGLWAPAVEKPKKATVSSTPAKGIKKKSTWDPGTQYIMNNILRQSQQRTFNTYMWSRGYSGWSPMGKSW